MGKLNRLHKDVICHTLQPLHPINNERDESGVKKEPKSQFKLAVYFKALAQKSLGLEFLLMLLMESNYFTKPKNKLT